MNSKTIIFSLFYLCIISTVCLSQFDDKDDIKDWLEQAYNNPCELVLHNPYNVDLYHLNNVCDTFLPNEIIFITSEGIYKNDTLIKGNVSDSTFIQNQVLDKSFNYQTTGIAFQRYMNKDIILSFFKTFDRKNIRSIFLVGNEFNKKPLPVPDQQFFDKIKEKLYGEKNLILKFSIVDSLRNKYGKNCNAYIVFLHKIRNINYETSALEYIVGSLPETLIRCQKKIDVRKILTLHYPLFYQKCACCVRINIKDVLSNKNIPIFY